MVGIDLSLRSTGLIALGEFGEYKDCAIVSCNLKNEALLEYNANKVCKFIAKNELIYSDIPDVTIEGLSFMSISGSKDILYGNFWHMRCKIMEQISEEIIFDVIPVTRWRSGIFSIETQREWKKQKAGLKEMAVNKLPEDVKINLNGYIEKEKLKNTAMYDLADAYWLAIFAYNQKNNITWNKL